MWFAVRDTYGAPVQHLKGEVVVTVTGPGELVGDSHILLAETGGVGAVWVKSKRKSRGALEVHASHPQFGTKTVSIAVEPVA